MLVIVAARLREWVSAGATGGATAARLGGDEFGVLIPPCAGERSKRRRWRW